MENEDTTLTLPMFHGMGKDDAKQHWFTFEAIRSMKRIMNEALNIAQLETTFRDISMRWYMKYKVTTLVGQTRSPIEIKRDLLRGF